MPAFGFDHSYARDLPGASIDWKPAPASAPRLLYLNEPLAEALGLDPASLRGEAGAALFSGNALPTDARPVAQAYAGHQFGGFSPQLGDGRALLIGELTGRDGVRRDVAFKGSGRTPFSRGGDGKAAVGPMLREVLIGEAMHALGIPTTRALAVAATGDAVMRETRLPGAVLTRVAASHLRVGTFQYFAARGDREALQRLLDYAIARHDPALRDAAVPALAFLRAVTARQAALIAQWMNVGFIHGVMNTDNMTISGETIDYGPCAFLEAVDPATVFSSIDHQGRYAYGRQPQMALWNLTRLAEALLSLLAPESDEPALERAAGQATEVLQAFPDLYAAALLRGQRAKLGLAGAPAAPASPDGAASAAEARSPTDAPVARGGEVSRDEAADVALVQAWLALLQAHRVDHTLAWRRLADAADGDEAPLRALFPDPDAPTRWLAEWREALPREDASAARADRAGAMRRVNPWIIPRNHRVEEALAAATDGDLAPFERLLDAVQRPWEETPAVAVYAEPAAAEATACYRTFCGT